jgi:uncharacterized membrane protein (GlpM family)
MAEQVLRGRIKETCMENKYSTTYYLIYLWTIYYLILLNNTEETACRMNTVMPWGTTKETAWRINAVM